MKYFYIVFISTLTVFHVRGISSQEAWELGPQLFDEYGDLSKTWAQTEQFKSINVAPIEKQVTGWSGPIVAPKEEPVTNWIDQQVCVAIESIFTIIFGQ